MIISELFASMYKWLERRHSQALMKYGAFSKRSLRKLMSFQRFRAHFVFVGVCWVSVLQPGNRTRVISIALQPGTTRKLRAKNTHHSSAS